MVNTGKSLHTLPHHPPAFTLPKGKPAAGTWSQAKKKITGFFLKNCLERTRVTGIGVGAQEQSHPQVLFKVSEIRFSHFRVKATCPDAYNQSSYCHILNLNGKPSVLVMFLPDKPLQIQCLKIRVYYYLSWFSGLSGPT